MHKPNCAFTAWALVWFSASAWAQTNQQELLQKLATVKESVARNQAGLTEYTWTEHTVITVKGEANRTEISTCRYLPDGQIQRSPVSTAAETHSALKARIFEKKYAAIGASIRQSLDLLHRYLPPSAGRMSAAYQAGNASLCPAAPAEITLCFRNYLQSGDSLAFAFDSATRSLRKVTVDTYLGEPKDPVTLSAAFEKLPSGPNYASASTLNEKAKGIQILIQNTNYQKME
jgi:hypothetical protein